MPNQNDANHELSPELVAAILAALAARGDNEPPDEPASRWARRGRPSKPWRRTSGRIWRDRSRPAIGRD